MKKGMRLGDLEVAPNGIAFRRLPQPQRIILIW